MELVHDRRGSGEPLVLLHGIGSRWQVFTPVLDLLAADFEVFAVDLPGFGASAPLPGGVPSIAALTDAIGSWIAGQGIEGAHVAGNSTGGGVALELADRGVVASATGLAPIGFWSARERAFCQSSVTASRALSRRVRPLAPALLSHAPVRAAFFAQYLAHPARVDPSDAVDDLDALIRCSGFEDVRASFTGYLAPATAADRVAVTVAWGDKDRLLLPRQARRARARLPRARHVIIPGAGHLMMADQPAAVAAVIRAGARAPAPS
ncbi:MAG: dehH [Solirubrobacteraceae bacterium]|nr:dehH [Solirubrobacteraceae bacterium]